MKISELLRDVRASLGLSRGALCKAAERAVDKRNPAESGIVRGWETERSTPSAATMQTMARNLSIEFTVGSSGWSWR